MPTYGYIYIYAEDLLYICIYISWEFYPVWYTPVETRTIILRIWSHSVKTTVCLVFFRQGTACIGLDGPCDPPMSTMKRSWSGVVVPITTPKEMRMVAEQGGGRI